MDGRLARLPGGNLFQLLGDAQPLVAHPQERRPVLAAMRGLGEVFATFGELAISRCSGGVVAHRLCRHSEARKKGRFGVAIARVRF